MAHTERVRFAARTRFRRGVAFLLTAAPFALGLYACVAAIMQDHSRDGVVLLGIGAFVSLLLHLRTKGSLPTPGPFETAAVAVDEGVVTIRTGKDVVELRPKDVKRAYVVPRGGAAEVIIETENGRCELSAHRVAFAREIIEALGQAPSQKPCTFGFAGGLRVTVAVDGVLVAWPLLRRRRFVPHVQIARVTDGPEGVTLALSDGSTYEIAIGGHPREVEKRVALVERLNEARDAYNRAEGAGATVHLERLGRSLEDWVRESKALTSGGGGRYRAAAPPPEVLWRIVTDPSEDEEKRVGASLALRGVLDDEGRERLRVAAEAAASPKVRVALLASADEEDDEAVIERMKKRA